MFRGGHLSRITKKCVKVESQSGIERRPRDRPLQTRRTKTAGVPSAFKYGKKGGKGGRPGDLGRGRSIMSPPGPF